MALVFDGLLGLALLWLAWQALSCPQLFKAIVLFIAFGLLVALAWVRLQAPDIALAEAAIGSGLTGALLLAALARLRRVDTASAGKHRHGHGDANRAAVTQLSTHPSSHPSRSTVIATHRRRYLGPLTVVALLGLAAGLGYAIWSLPPQAGGLGDQVAEQLAVSGVANPVTAVLLNFRGYDTLLEMLVLLLALLGVWSLGGNPARHHSAPGPVLDTLARLLAPLLILVAAYLLWVGADAPGGAFQAGSVLAAAGVLLLMAGWRPSAAFSGWPLRLLVVTGAAAFVGLALLTLLVEGQLLGYPPARAGSLILLLETTATLSIGATLAALLLEQPPAAGDSPPPLPPASSSKATAMNREQQ